MKTIWKFPLEITDHQPVIIPADRQLLDVQMQGGKPCLWALVDPGSDRKVIFVAMRGTGHEIAGRAGNYIATFQVGPLVFHAFEVLA